VIGCDRAAHSSQPGAVKEVEIVDLGRVVGISDPDTHSP
jgi:hypothetical protein